MSCASDIPRGEAAAVGGREHVHVVDLLEHQLRRMALSLHDGPLQTLSAASAMLQRTRRSDQIDALHAQVAAAEGLLDCMVLEMRDLMNEMRPAELDEESLVAKLREYVQRYETRAGIPVEFAVNGPEIPCDPQTQTSLFRVVQEALSNTWKHAHARSATVVVGFSPDRIECTVSDDGLGFDVDRAAALSGMAHWGLAGMRERMLLVGGDLSITSRDGEGTTVRADVPCIPE